MDERDLIRRLSEGNEEAFEYVFKKHYAKLCLYAEHYLKDKQAAMETVEDFFVFFWDRCHNIIIESTLSGYLYRSIHNRCLKYLRHEKVKQKYIEAGKYYFTDDELLEPVSDDLSEALLISRELQDKVREAIDSLPGQCRRIFIMSRFDDLSYSEISEKLGISFNTVKTQMARALRKMRDSLIEYLTIVPWLIIISIL